MAKQKSLLANGQEAPASLPSAATKEEAAYRYLREAISTGMLKPNDRLPISDWAQRLEVSEIPVRAALQRLSGEGFVEFRPNVGYRVAVPDPVLVLEAVVTLGALWELAGRLAAANATDDQLANLASIRVAARRAAERDDVLEFAMHSVQFHEELARASGNTYVLKLTRQVTLDAQRGTVQLRGRPERIQESIRSGEMVMEALMARRGERAAELLRWYMEDSAIELERMGL